MKMISEIPTFSSSISQSVAASNVTPAVNTIQPMQQRHPGASFFFVLFFISEFHAYRDIFHNNR